LGTEWSVWDFWGMALEMAWLLDTWHLGWACLLNSKCWGQTRAPEFKSNISIEIVYVLYL